jgi:hypothetical protein
VSHIAFASEEELLLPLLRYLVRQRLIRSDTLVATQLRFNEKWIDLVTLTSTGSLTAYELKLNHMARVLEQAAANTLSCDRSYAVTASRPGSKAELHASILSVGLLEVRSGGVHRRLISQKQKPLPVVRRQLIAAVESKGELVAHVPGL